MKGLWIAVATFAAMMGAAGPAAAEYWRYCEAYTKDPERQHYVTELYPESEFRSLSYAASAATVGLALRYSYDCWGDSDQAAADARRQSSLSRAKSNGFTPVPWDVRARLKHRLSYYYCEAPAGNQMLISDLILNPGWVEPTMDQEAFAKLALAAGGRGYDTRCRHTTPLGYIKALNEGYPKYRLVRTTYTPEGKVFGPNLVDDLVAREKYAKLWADPRNLPVPGAEPPKPTPAAVPKPATSTGGSLTIKQDTSAADARRAWDAQVAKTLADEAQKRAQAAIKTAQNDAKAQADAEKARQERLKRGRAQ